MIIWTDPVIRRADGSYVVTVGGHPYHAPAEGEFAPLWAEIDAWAREHPDEVTDEVIQEPPTLEEVIAGYEARIQGRLDHFARTLTYDGIMSACTYATSGIEMYRIEGQYCVDARDLTWAKAFELLNGFCEGDTVPTWEEIEAQLPNLSWPEGSRGYAAA